MVFKVVNDMEEMLIKASELLERGEVIEAIKELGKCAKADPQNGDIAFMLGNIALKMKDFENAYQYLKKSETLGYASVDLYLWLSNLEEELDNIKETESYLIKAFNTSKDDIEKTVVLERMIEYYIEHSMYLKAEKYIKNFATLHPNSYLPHHFRVNANLSRNRQNEAMAYLLSISSQYNSNPLYLNDYIRVIASKGEYANLIEEINSNNEFMNKIPVQTLKAEYNAYEFLSDGNNRIRQTEILSELALDYNDTSAMLSIMMLLYSKEEYEKAGTLCSVIMEKELDNRNIYFYFALYYSIFCLFNLSNGKPSKELVEVIENSGNACLEYFSMFKEKELFDAMETSIDYLFSQINMFIDDGKGY